MIIQIIASIIVGSILWLDRVFIFQLMVSRPIILATILGTIMGDVYIGLIIGASLELLWLNSPPVGAYLPNDESFCAAIATPLAVYAHIFFNEIPAAGLALILSLPFSNVGKKLDVYIRDTNQRLLPDVIDNIETSISHAMTKALLHAFVYALFSLGICTAILFLIVFVIKDHLPLYFITALSFMPFASIIIGLAALISKGVPRLPQVGMFMLGIAIILIMKWIL